MPKLKKRLPSYCKHKASGQAVVTLSGRDYYLGPHGTASSRAAYERLVARWLSGDLAAAGTDLTIGELASQLRPETVAGAVRRRTRQRVRSEGV